MASPERVRIEIAFDGGQLMGALVTPASADALEQALGAADLRDDKCQDSGGKEWRACCHDGLPSQRVRASSDFSNTRIQLFVEWNDFIRALKRRLGKDTSPEGLTRPSGRA